MQTRRALIVTAFFLSLFCCSTVFAQETTKQIRERIVRERKPAVVYLFTPSWAYCRRMDRDVLETKEIREELGTSVAYFRVNGDTAPHIVRENNLVGYPTTILLDETGKKLIQIPGLIGKKDFKTVLAYLTGKHYKKMPLIDYLKKKDAGSGG